MDAITWLKSGRNWGGTLVLAAAVGVGQPTLAQQSTDNSVVVIVDDAPTATPAAVIASDEPVASRQPTPIHWSTPKAGPSTRSHGVDVPDHDVAVVANDQPAEPLRAARPTFIQDGQVVPASLYGGGSVFASPQQPLRRSTTLQLRPLSGGGRSLSDRLGSLTGHDEHAEAPAPPVEPRRPATARGPGRAPADRKQLPSQPVETVVEQPVVLNPATAGLLRAHELSLAANSEGEYSQIIQLCSDAVRTGVDGEQRQFATQLAAWALNRRGEVRTEDGQDGLAMADFRAALDFQPDHWRTLHNRGVTLAQQGQFAEAFDDISRVIEINPDFAKAYANRATLYVQAGDTQSALADFTRAIELDGQLTPALIGRGRLLHLLGRWDDALADFDASIAAGDADAALYCSRGDLLADLGRYGDALADYAAAVDVDATCAHAYRNGAWLLATCPDDSFRDAEHALVGAQQALKCGYGERHAALDCLAAALANAGRFDEARVAEQQAIDVAPNEVREAYQYRLQLYEADEPYRTSPVTD